MELRFEKHALSNGLEVVLHQDRTDPVVAVYVYYHVGSSREEPGLTGFAHLFEHMLFQGSENVPEGDHFRLIQEAGGTLNGTTNEDRTNYYETLPSNRLELALWLESDRMGFLLPAMTQAKLDNQRDVVKNERRQNYDNRPYGRVREALAEAMYPAGHPLSWTTIGSMEDLDRVTLGDVERFFGRYYNPNNATLAIGGDIEPDEALALAERWFGGLPAGPQVAAPEPRAAGLAEERRVVQEDRVTVPQLTLAWPTVPTWHPDEPALNLMCEVLSANRSALLDKALMVDEELASAVMIGNRGLELDGSLSIHARPTPGVSLTALAARIDELLATAAEREVGDEHLERLCTRREGMIVRALDTVSARTSTLGSYNLFHGDPGRLGADLERHRAVTRDDVLRVLHAYVLGRPRVVLSVVPSGEPELAA
ncbi:MAG: pitrilysin family protein [Planctomycetota bacterium]